jgi:Ala-tRNA(Pro) deacylase
MTAATKEVAQLLEGEGIRYELLPHLHTETAGEEAKALGVDPHEVAKTLVLRSGKRFVRAVIAACDRLDVRKVRDLLELHAQPHLAHEDELTSAYPVFELGAVPPVGGPTGDRVVVDRRLADRETIVIEAGSHDESVRLGTTDLLVLAHAAIGDLCHADAA